MFQGIFKSAINDVNKNYIFGTGSIPIQIKTAQLATFADGTTKQQGYQVAEVKKLISTMLTGWDADGNKPKSMSDNYLELILSCDNGFVVKKKLQFPHIIAWKDDNTPYNIADVYKEFSVDNWLKADDFENPDITLVVEPTDEILTTSTANPPEATTAQSGRFYLYYRNLPVGINRVHIDFHIKTKTEPIDFDLEVANGLSWKDAQVILASNKQAKINVLLSTAKDVYKFTGAEGIFEEITMHEWSALYQQIISLNPNNRFTHDLYFYIYDESELNTKLTELERKVTGEYTYVYTIFANDRLNELISVNNKEISVCVNLVSGEDDSIVRVYAKDLSTILVNNKKFGEVFNVVVPEGDEQIVVFTTNKIATNTRKFEVIITDGGIYKALENKPDDAPKDDKPYFRQNGEWRETEIDKILDVSTAKEDSIAGAKITAHKFSNVDSLLNGGEVTINANVEYSDNYLDINFHKQNKYCNFKKHSVGDDVTVYLDSPGGTNNGYAFARCEIKAGVTYKCYGNVNEYAALVITDENAIIVSKITSGDYTITPYIFTAETNGYLFVQTTTFTDWETCKAIHIETIQYDGVVPLLEDVANSASPLKDKTIVCLGDSITEFIYQGKGYVEYLSELTKANVIRGGIGGSRISSRNPNFAEPTSEGRARAGLDMVNLVNAWCSGDFTAIDADVEWIKTNLSVDYSHIVNNLKNTPITSVDIVTIFGGTNDFSGGVQFGTDTDTDVAIFIPALKSVIDTINIANPKAKVYVLTPIVRYFASIKDDEHWSDVYLNANGNTLPELVEIIKDVSKSRHTPCCDLYWGLGWNKNNFDAYFISTDFTHPYFGFSALAEKISKYLISN